MIDSSWPTSGHGVYRFNVGFCNLYDYDPTDDGPECEVITRILASHPRYAPGVEKRALRLSLLTSQLERRK